MATTHNKIRDKFIDNVYRAVNAKDKDAVVTLLRGSPRILLSIALSLKIKEVMPDVYKELIHSDLEFEEKSEKCSIDIQISTKYQNKVKDASNRKLKFDLTFNEFKKVMVAKRCYFTGLPIDLTTCSIDRVDNSIGYIPSNVVACHTSVNSLKGSIENPQSVLTIKNVTKMLGKWKERIQ